MHARARALYTRRVLAPLYRVRSEKARSRSSEYDTDGRSGHAMTAVYVTPPPEPSDEPAVPWDHSAFVEDSYYSDANGDSLVLEQKYRPDVETCVGVLS